MLAKLPPKRGECDAEFEILMFDLMTRFYEPDLGADLDSPFARDAANKLVRRSYWLDMNDRTLVMVMVNGIGAHLTNDEKRAHLTDLKQDTSSIRSVFKRFCHLKTNRPLHV